MYIYTYGNVGKLYFGSPVKDIRSTIRPSNLIAYDSFESWFFGKGYPHLIEESVFLGAEYPVYWKL